MDAIPAYGVEPCSEGEDSSDFISVSILQSFGVFFRDSLHGSQVNVWEVRVVGTEANKVALTAELRPYGRVHIWAGVATLEVDSVAP